MKKIIKEIVRWLAITKLFPRSLEKILGYYHFYRNETVLSFTGTNSKIFKLICQIKKEVRMFLSIPEAFQIYLAVAKIKNISGDIAEVGVGEGGSAKLISEANDGNKTIHLFDTFEGLPEISGFDNPQKFFERKYAVSLDKVKDYLKNYVNIYFYKGIFPSTAEPIENKKFSFIHLDADIYESTLNSLKFFYPRMNAGGIILSHDYPGAEGVKKAFDEFFKDKPETIIELLGWEANGQCLIVKL